MRIEAWGLSSKIMRSLLMFGLRYHSTTMLLRCVRLPYSQRFSSALQHGDMLFIIVICLHCERML